MWPWKKKVVDTSPAGIALAEVEAANPKIGDWTKKVASMVSPKGADIKVLRDGLAAIDAQLAERQVGTMPIEKMSVHTSKQIVARKYLDRAYPKLDLNVLGWRKKVEGFSSPAPVFGLFDPFNADNTCEIETHLYFGSMGKSTNVLKIGDRRHVFLARFYDDISTGHTYTAGFSGFIPSHVRRHLQDLQDLQKTTAFSYSSDPKLYELLLIAECDWQIRATPPDPLAIALMATDAWLLASFDTTAIENIVASEFTS
jgi:hypothetical protein